MLCICCFLAAAFLYDIHIVIKIVFASAALFLAIVFYIISVVLKSKDAKRRFAITATALLFAFISLCESLIYFNVYVADFEQYIDENCEIECEVIEENQGNGADMVYVKLISVNGERKLGNSVIYFNYPENIGRGKRIVLNAKGIEFDALDYYGGKSKLLSDGISSAFYAENYDDVNLIILDDTKNFYISLTDFAYDLSYKLANGVGGEEGNFSAAILFGRRDLLSAQTSRDFARSGISHILALSGLHLALISGLIELFLRKIYLPKIARCFVIIPFVVFYTAMTGFSMSALRAAVMLTIFYIYFIFSRPVDSLTTVGIAGLLIVIFLPFSITSSGFIMSLAATFGIIVTAPYLSKFLMNRRKDKVIKTAIKKIGRFAVSSLTVTVAANVAVLYYTWSMFGQISLATPLANLVITPVVAVQLAAAALYVLFGNVPFIGATLAWVQKTVGKYILSSASFFSDIKGICVSLNYDFAGIIVIALLLSIAVLLIVKLRHKWLIASPIILSLVAFFICISVSFSANKNAVVAEYMAFKEREMLVLTQNGETVICDISDGSYNNFYNAYKTARSRGATEIDVLLLTHYHGNHAVSVERFCNDQKVRNIWVPVPKSEEAYYTLKSISETAEKNGVNLVVYNDNADLTVFYDGVLKIYPHEMLKRSTQPALAFEFSYGNDKLLYVGSSATETLLSEIITESLSSSDIVIFGTHGPNPKQTYGIDAAKDAKNLVFSDRELIELARASADTDFSGDIICECNNFRFEMSK